MQPAIFETLEKFRDKESVASTVAEIVFRMDSAGKDWMKKSAELGFEPAQLGYKLLIRL